MLKKVIIPVFTHTTSSKNLDSMGLRIDTKDLEVKEITAYKIDFISSYKEEDSEDSEYGREFALFNVNGREFSSPLTKEELETLVDKGL